MKKTIMLLGSLFFITVISSAVFGQPGQSDGSNEDNTASETSIDHLKCWEGSNAGNQHDVIEEPHIVDGEVCPPGDDNSISSPKHCTQDNKLGLKHTQSASGC